MVMVDSSVQAPYTSGLIQGSIGAGGAPTGGGTAGQTVTTSTGARGAGGPGSTLSVTHWLIIFILVDMALLFGIGYVFRTRNL
jgi:hypothetical protein